MAADKELLNEFKELIETVSLEIIKEAQMKEAELPACLWKRTFRKGGRDGNLPLVLDAGESAGQLRSLRW